jgi:hypothetical protein
MISNKEEEAIDWKSLASESGKVLATAPDLKFSDREQRTAFSRSGQPVWHKSNTFIIVSYL